MSYCSDADDFSTNHWNAAWFATFGFDAVSAQGRSGTDLGIWVLARTASRTTGARHARENRSAAWKSACATHGALRWISLSARPFVEAQRTLIVLSYFDITERRHAQRKSRPLTFDWNAWRSTADLKQPTRELTQTLEALRGQDQLVQSKSSPPWVLWSQVWRMNSIPPSVTPSRCHFAGIPIAGNSETAMARGLKRSDLQNLLDDTRQSQRHPDPQPHPARVPWSLVSSRLRLTRPARNAANSSWPSWWPRSC